MATIQRPVKTYGNRTYAAEVAAAPSNEDPILATEVDGDLDTMYAAWNAGADTVNIKDGAVTYAKLAPDAKLWSDNGTALVPTRVLTVPFNGNALGYGGRTIKHRLWGHPTSDVTQWTLNRDPTTNLRDDNASPAWLTSMYASINQWRIDHYDAAGTSRLDFYIDGATGKTSCTLADASVTQPMLAAGAAVRTVINGSVTAGASATTTATKFATVSGSNLNGRTNLVFLNSMLAIAVVAAGQGYAIKVMRNAVDFLQWGGNCGAGAAVEFPLPTYLCFFDTTAPAGTVTYEWFFWTSSTGTNIHVPSSTQGQTQIVSYS
jgi:hypothetical protein